METKRDQKLIQPNSYPANIKLERNSKKSIKDNTDGEPDERPYPSKVTDHQAILKQQNCNEKAVSKVVTQLKTNRQNDIAK